MPEPAHDQPSASGEDLADVPSSIAGDQGSYLLERQREAAPSPPDWAEAMAAVREVRWRAFPLTTFTDSRGSVTPVEAGEQLPFSIERVYFLHSVQPGQRRAGHAHRTLEQVLIAVAGSFEVTCDDGRSRRRYRLDRPDEGLHIASMVWIDLEKFAPGSVCLVLASAPHDPADYWSAYEEFVADSAAGP